MDCTKTQDLDYCRQFKMQFKNKKNTIVATCPNGSSMGLHVYVDYAYGMHSRYKAQLRVYTVILMHTFV